MFDGIGKEIRLRTGRVERYESGFLRMEYEVGNIIENMMSALKNDFQ